MQQHKPSSFYFCNIKYLITNYLIEVVKDGITYSSIVKMKLIAETFNQRFSHWEITLPEEDFKERCSGHVQKAGWLIQYCFGKDDEGEYLDYYAAHRMTDDSHIRIRFDGSQEALPALHSWLFLSDDPVEAKRLEDEHDRHNSEVVNMLFEKGFDKFTINMFLSAGMDK